MLQGRLFHAYPTEDDALSQLDKGKTTNEEIYKIQRDGFRDLEESNKRSGVSGNQ